MSKAILVMDMPESCSECNLHKDGYCQSKLKYTYGRIDECRASFCPLREIPQKKDSMNLNAIMENCKERDSIMDSVLKQFIVDGYNACIDEILKGAEENG